MTRNRFLSTAALLALLALPAATARAASTVLDLGGTFAKACGETKDAPIIAVCHGYIAGIAQSIELFKGPDLKVCSQGATYSEIHNGVIIMARSSKEAAEAFTPQLVMAYLLERCNQKDLK